MSLLKNVFVPILLFLSIHISLQWKYFTDFPNHIHAWTQSDRYALALGFVDNNLDLFHPQTYYLNPTKAQPDLNRDSGITAVDFPLPDYLAAIAMKVTGSKAPIHFRIVVFLFFIIGMYFLFLLIKTITSSYNKGLIYSLLFSLSPVLVYYSNGFIPSVPAFCLSIIAFYYAYLHQLSNNKKHLILGLIFFTIAAMIRTTFVLPLGAYLTWLLVSNKPIEIIKKNFAILLIPALFLIYRLYNSYLTSKYGSIFLGSLMPPSNYQDFKDIIQLTLHNWIYHYFSIPQYIFLLIGLSYIFITPGKSKLFLFASINTLFAIIFSFLLFKQFPAHDYYFIDLWMFPALTWLIVSIKTIQQLKIEKNIIALLSIFLIVLAYQSVKDKQTQRRDTGSWDQQGIQTHQFETSKPFFEELNLNKKDKVLILGATTTNIPLIKMHQKGYTIIHTSQENIQQALSWDWDYVVIPNINLFSDVLKNDTTILSLVEKVKSNAFLTVFKKSLVQEKSIEELLKMKKIATLQNSSYSGNDEFIQTLSLSPEKLDSDLLIARIDPITLERNVELVISSDGDSKFNRFSSVIEKNYQNSFYQLIPLTDLKKNAHELKVYIYNPNKTFVEVDRFVIESIILK